MRRPWLLMGAVLVTSLPWMGALLAYALQARWPLSAVQAHWLQGVRQGCATVLLAEWILAPVAAVAWAVVLLVARFRRRPGADPDAS